MITYNYCHSTVPVYVVLIGNINAISKTDIEIYIKTLVQKTVLSITDNDSCKHIYIYQYATLVTTYTCSGHSLSWFDKRDKLITQFNVWFLHRQVPILRVVIQVKLVFYKHVVYDTQQTFRHVQEWLMSLKV